MTKTVTPAPKQTKENIAEDGEPPLEKNKPPVEWDDWHWQIKNSITTLKELEKIIDLTDDEKSLTHLPLRISPYYSQLLSNPAIRKCVVPTMQELNISDCEQSDSLAEERDRKTEHIVHRYPDRALFLTTNICASNCRYCTRSRLVDNNEHTISHAWEESFEYIKNHPEIRDVLLSGGDPLLLSDEQIDYLLMRLYAIPTVEMVRIGTKVPVVLPMRITENLIKVLSKYDPLYMSIHFTHPAELTPEVAQACARLRQGANCILGSQTVVLAGVNATAQILGDLFKGLLKIGVKPYYLYTMDKIQGGNHFVVPISKILGIMKELIGKISGYAIPHFVCDLPGGGGKTPLVPNYIEKVENNEYTFKNWNNKEYKVIDKT